MLSFSLFIPLSDKTKDCHMIDSLCCIMIDLLAVYFLVKSNETFRQNSK